MKLLFSAISLFFFFTTAAQEKYNALLLDTLNQIALTNTLAKHFAKLYYNAIEATNKQAATQPENVKRFIFGFEAVFAPEFFRSTKKFEAHEPQESCWKNYYADSNLNQLQYQFMGMNAHINGDMWLALKEKYTYDTLRHYKHPLIEFQKALNVYFDSLYATANQYKRVKYLHAFTIGLDKAIGKKMILHWRKRQISLALLSYTNPAKCARKCRRLKRKMRQYDDFAMEWIK